jgi:hypothetical protein
MIEQREANHARPPQLRTATCQPLGSVPISANAAKISPDNTMVRATSKPAKAFTAAHPNPC